METVLLASSLDPLLLISGDCGDSNSSPLSAIYGGMHATCPDVRRFSEHLRHGCFFSFLFLMLPFASNMQLCW